MKMTPDPAVGQGWPVMPKLGKGLISLRIIRTAVICGIVLGSLCGCGRHEDYFGKNAHALVDDAVPKVLRELPPAVPEVFAGDIASENIARLRKSGWTVEDFTRDDTHSVNDLPYTGEFIIDLTQEEMSKLERASDEGASDFTKIGMQLHWHEWDGLFGAEFFKSFEAYEKASTGHFYRLISPSLDRVYDVVIIRSRNPADNLISESVTGKGAGKMWSLLNPANREEFPHLSIFGPVRYVVPVAAKQVVMGNYSVSQVYAKRYYPAGTFLGAVYGSERSRDAYVLTVLSKKEFVAVQIFLTRNADVKAVAADIGSLFDQKINNPRKPGGQVVPSSPRRSD